MESIRQSFEFAIQTPGDGVLTLATAAPEGMREEVRAVFLEVLGPGAFDVMGHAAMFGAASCRVTCTNHCLTGVRSLVLDDALPSRSYDPNPRTRVDFEIRTSLHATATCMCLGQCGPTFVLRCPLVGDRDVALAKLEAVWSNLGVTAQEIRDRVPYSMAEPLRPVGGTREGRHQVQPLVRLGAASPLPMAHEWREWVELAVRETRYRDILDRPASWEPTVTAHIHAGTLYITCTDRDAPECDDAAGIATVIARFVERRWGLRTAVSIEDVQMDWCDDTFAERVSLAWRATVP